MLRQLIIVMFQQTQIPNEEHHPKYVNKVLFMNMCI